MRKVIDPSRRAFLGGAGAILVPTFVGCGDPASGDGNSALAGTSGGNGGLGGGGGPGTSAGGGVNAGGSPTGVVTGGGPATAAGGNQAPGGNAAGGATTGDGGAANGGATTGNGGTANGGAASGGEGGAGGAPNTAGGPVYTKIAFGACLKNAGGGPIMNDIAAQAPDLMLWLGDNVYADTTDPVKLRGTYTTLQGNPNFQKLSAACRNEAIWDDHDYGVNNGGGDYGGKATAREEFFRMWNVPMGSPRRDAEGVYHAFSSGPAGKRVQVIMLDMRYNKSPWGMGNSPTATMLGAKQWDWFAQQLDEPADIRIIGNGVQVLTTGKGKTTESWAQMPNEQQKLFALIQAKKAKGVVYISGDQHWGEASVIPNVHGYDAVELTAAGLDRTEDDIISNTYRVGDVANGTAKFGLISIDWVADPVITLQVIYPGGTSALEYVRKLSTLTPV